MTTAWKAALAVVIIVACVIGLVAIVTDDYAVPDEADYSAVVESLCKGDATNQFGGKSTDVEVFESRRVTNSGVTWVSYTATGRNGDQAWNCIAIAGADSARATVTAEE